MQSRYCSLPVWRKLPARRREHIRPHVEHRQQVIAALRIEHRYNQRLLGEIEPRDGVERIEVRPHHSLEIRWGEYSGTFENVFIGPLPNSFPDALLVNCLRVMSIVTS